MFVSTAVKLLLLSAASVSVASDYTPEALADQITSLPGAENLDITFNQFSGYLKVGDTKNLHYWLVESTGNPSTDPIALWTNGGPGCSGLLGFFTEQGPFRPNEDLTLSMNPYAWNSIANMVFIESPCGVGFSYSDEPEGDDYHTDDAQTAEDNYMLIQAFMDRFPQFRSNSLYITSESYGGHYMPTLAKEIVDRNADKDNTLPVLNFKGFAVGNPATTFYSAIPASMDTYWGHQLISKPLYDKYVDTCKTVGKIRDWEVCEEIFMAMYKQVGDLNPYALDYPVCTEETVSSSATAVGNNKKQIGGSRTMARYGRAQRTWLLNHMLEGMISTATDGANSTAAVTAVANMRAALQLEPVEGYEPCAEDYMTAYLAQQNVREAIHVKTDITWADCSRSLRYKQTDGMNSMTGYYNYLIDGKFGLDILVYSGDDDDVCATIGTQSWIWDLGYEEAPRDEVWGAYTVDGQTAGYLTKWKDTRLALATVHGAGHEVPTYKPQAALYLFQEYLKGTLTDA